MRRFKVILAVVALTVSMLVASATPAMAWGNGFNHNFNRGLNTGGVFISNGNVAGLGFNTLGFNTFGHCWC